MSLRNFWTFWSLPCLFEEADSFRRFHLATNSVFYEPGFELLEAVLLLVKIAPTTRVMTVNFKWPNAAAETTAAHRRH